MSEQSISIDFRLVKPNPLAVMLYLRDHGRTSVKKIVAELPLVNGRKMLQSDVSEALGMLYARHVVDRAHSPKSDSSNEYWLDDTSPLLAIIETLQPLVGREAVA